MKEEELNWAQRCMRYTHTHTNGADHQLKQMSIPATQATIVNQAILQLDPRKQSLSASDTGELVFDTQN